MVGVHLQMVSKRNGHELLSAADQRLSVNIITAPWTAFKTFD
jgi:hypothetical protein